MLNGVGPAEITIDIHPSASFNLGETRMTKINLVQQPAIDTKTMSTLIRFAFIRAHTTSGQPSLHPVRLLAIAVFLSSTE